MSSKVRRGSDYAKDANYSTRCSNNFWENSTPDRNGGNSCDEAFAVSLHHVHSSCGTVAHCNC